MGGAIDRGLNIVLTASAVALVATVFTRTFGTTPAQRASEPQFVDKWQDIALIGQLIGPERAPVVIVEFGDYQCPFCASFHSAVKEVRAAMGDSVALSYVHFPLQGIHPHAIPAAHAAECAAAQFRFEAIHDLLFSKQDVLGVQSWTSLAEEAGVSDLAAFDACMGNRETATTVERHASAADDLSIRGTPGVMINGWLYPGGVSGNELLSEVRSIAQTGKPARSDR